MAGGTRARDGTIYTPRASTFDCLLCDLQDSHRSRPLEEHIPQGHTVPDFMGCRCVFTQTQGADHGVGILKAGLLRHLRRAPIAV